MFWTQKTRCARDLGFAALSIGALGSVLPAFAYVVKPGDTLSQIARQALGAPVYGQRGTLSKLLGMNPQLRNPNAISPGEHVRLGEDSNSARAAVETSPTDRAPATDQTVAPESAANSEVASTMNAAQAPLVQTAPVSTSDEELTSELQIAPRVYFSRLDGEDRGNGSQAKILSRVNYAMDIKWQQNWSDKFRTALLLDLRRESYFQDVTDDSSITNAAQNLAGFGVAASFVPLADFTLSGGVIFSQELYYHGSPSGQGVVLDPVLQSKFKLGLDYVAFKKSSFSMLVGTDLSYAPFKSTTAFYTTDPEFGVDANVRLQQKFQSGNGIFAGFGYGWQQANTSLVKFHRQQLYFSFGTQLVFGGGAQAHPGNNP